MVNLRLTTGQPVRIWGEKWGIQREKKLVQSAVKGFYRDGFRNVGIDQILNDVGISKTAFYKHFESKEDLMLAALELQNQWLQQTFRAMIVEFGGQEPKDQLYAILDVVKHLIDSEDFQGCIFINVSMEFPLPHEPAHQAAAESKRAIEQIITDIATEAGASNPPFLARQLCLVIEGIYVTRQVSGNCESVEVARKIARLVIESELGKPGSQVEEIAPSEP